MRPTTTLRNRTLLLLTAGLTLAACGESTPGPGVPLPGLGGKADGTAVAKVLTLTTPTLDSHDQFTAMSFENGGVLVQGRSVKFLIDYRQPQLPGLYFMNAGYKAADGSTPDSARYHYYLAEAVLPNFAEDIASFNQATYNENTKRFFAGTLQAYRLGQNQELVYAIQFYPSDVISEETLLTALQIVRAGIKIAGVPIAFVATGPQQTVARIGAQLAALSMPAYTIDQVLGSVNYIPMNQGEAYGYLRIFPVDQGNLSPRDIVVFDELPLDLTVVAGTITRAYQDASSHINLKSKERGTANMVLRDAGPSHAELALHADQPVHLVVRSDGYVLEPTTAAEIERRFQEQQNRPWVPLTFEPATDPLTYDEMCPAARPGDCLAKNRRFGSKAANLSFLRHPRVLGKATDAGSLSQRFGYDLAPGGVGVPLQFYWDLVNHPANGALRGKLEGLVALAKDGTASPNQLNGALAEVQQLFYDATLPPEIESKVRAKLNQALPGVTRLKVRSSANAEDLPNFDGAGLYNSYSVRLNDRDNAGHTCRQVLADDGDLDMEPRTIACAIKGAYGSVWNRRAIDERSFARLDHATASMGLAIVARYSNESDVAANSVLVTRVINADGTLGYTLSNQVGNNLVTNPTPGTYSEVVIAAFSDPGLPPSFVTTRYAKPDVASPQLTSNVYTQDIMLELVQIGSTVEDAYCRARPNYYPGGNCDYVGVDPSKPTSLDLELKFLEDGSFVFKQVREFAGK